MLIERYDHGDCEIAIYTDDDAPSPRDDFDHAGTMVCWHNRYTLGDKDGENQIRADLGDLCPDYPEPGDLYNAAIEAGFHVLPLYLYDHSGITMNVSGFVCPWDSGQVGFIYMTPEKAKEWGADDPEKCLRAEVEEYDMYLTGQVYGYIVTHKKNDTYDESCWGFFGEEYVKEEAESVAEYLSNRYREDWVDSVQKTACW